MSVWASLPDVPCLAYQGSGHRPTERDRKSVIDLANLPGHLFRPTKLGDHRNRYLRLGVDAHASVVLRRRDVEALIAELTAWLDAEEAWE